MGCCERVVKEAVELVHLSFVSLEAEGSVSPQLTAWNDELVPALVTFHFAVDGVSG